MARKTAKRDQIVNNQAVEATKSLDVTSVTTEISELGNRVQKQLVEINGNVLSQLNKLEQVNTAISLQEQRLKELYDVEAASVKSDELEAKIEQEREQWEVEKLNRNTQWDDEDNQRVVDRNRQEEEYEAQLRLTHQKKLFALEEDYNSRLKTYNDQFSKQNEVWAKREEALKVREAKMADLEKQVAEFPTVLDKEVKKHVAMTETKLNKEHSHEVALTKATNDLTIQGVNKDNESLKRRVEDLVNQVKDVQNQLEKVRQDANIVASKALDTAQYKVAMADVKGLVETGASSVSSKR